MVVNSGEHTHNEIIEKNRNTFVEIQDWISENSGQSLKFHAFNVENMPHKYAGVGLARKIGMDEAYARLLKTGNEKGLIAGFDADALCAKNYFTEIEKHFDENFKTNGASIHFEHPLEGNEYSTQVYENIVLYELYLRYFKQALRFSGHPFAYHTIGSSFAVRAETYAKQGGMNRKKAGEDFYFLQKIIQLGNFTEISDTKVIPSPRPSDRVPFGTGAAIQKMLDSETTGYLTYHIQAFIDLKSFLAQKDVFFKIKKEDYDSIDEKADIAEIIMCFLNKNKFFAELKKINANSPNLKTFNSRFYQWFNAFRVIKFLNFAHEGYYTKERVEIQAANLIQISEEIPTCSFTPRDLLRKFRIRDM